MADYNDIVKLAVDAYHGTTTKYSVGESMSVLRQSMIEANGGSTVLDYKAIRDGKCNGLFTIVETILARTVVEGLQGDEYFNALVDFRNIALGDKNEFVVEDSTLFVHTFRYNTSAPIFPRLALDLLMYLSDDCDITKF